MRFNRKNVRQGSKLKSDRNSAEIRLAAWQALRKGSVSRRIVAEPLESRTLLTGTPVPIFNPNFSILYEPGTDTVAPSGAILNSPNANTATLPGGAGTFDTNPFGPSAITLYQTPGSIQDPNTQKVTADAFDPNQGGTGASVGKFETAPVTYSDGTTGNFVDVPGWTAPSFPATYAQVVNVGPQINASGLASIQLLFGTDGQPATGNVLQLNGPGAERENAGPSSLSLGPAFQTVTQQLTTPVQANTLYTLSVQVGVDITSDPTSLAIPVIANVEVGGTPLTLVSSNIDQVQNAIGVKAKHGTQIGTDVAFSALPTAVQNEFQTLAPGADFTAVAFGEYTENITGVPGTGQTFYAPDPAAPGADHGYVTFAGPDGFSQRVLLAVDPQGNAVGAGTFQTLTETFYADSAVATPPQGSSSAPLLTVALGTGPNSTIKSLQTSFSNVSLTQAPAAPSPVVGATIAASDILTAAASQTISVTYTSSNGFNPATAGISPQNIEIVGPFGNVLTNDTVGTPTLNSNGSMSVTYTLPAPDGGAFSNFDNGNYQVLVVPGSVTDNSGAAVGFESTSFTVSVPLTTTAGQVGPTLNFTSEAAATQSDGGTIIAGHTGSALDLTSGSGVELERLNSDGTPDLAFDNNFPGPSLLSAHSAFFGTTVVDPAVDPQNGGKIVAVGTDNGDIVVARFNSNGTLDTSFATNGVFHAGFPAGGDSQAFSVAIDPNKNIVVGGTDSIGDYLFIRLTPDGTPDISFNPNGQYNSQVQLSTGLTTRADQGVFLNQNGVATGGELVLSSGGQGGNAIDQIVLQPSTDGNPAHYTILGVGDASQNVGGIGGTETKVVAVFEVLSTGQPNPNFSSVVGGPASVATLVGSQEITGLALLPSLVPESLGANVAKSPIGIALQSNGDIIVVAGAADPLNSSNTDFGVERLLPNGLIDTTFGTGGIVTTAFPGGDAFANSVTIAAGDNIIVAGTSFGTAGLESAFAEYTPNGLLNTSFDMNLFAIDAADAGADLSDLNTNSSVDANLAADFTKANFALSSSAAVAVLTAGQEWSITDGGVEYILQLAGDGSINVTAPGIFVSPSGLTVSNAVHGVHGVTIVPPPAPTGVSTPITSAPGTSGTSTTLRIQFVDPSPQLAASQVSASTTTSTTPFTVVYTAPAGFQINASTITSGASTLQVTDTSTGGRAVTATLMPGQNLTNAQTVDVVYELTAPSNWMASDVGTYHVALPANSNVLDTETTPVALQTGEFGTFQLNVLPPLATVGTGLQLGAVTGKIPSTAVGGTRFAPPLHMLVTNDSVNKISGSAVLSVYASVRNDTYDGAELLRNIVVKLNLKPGKAEMLTINRLTWPGAPGDYYLLASLVGPTGATLNENIGTTAAVVHVMQPVADLETLSVTPRTSVLSNGRNTIFAEVENVGNVSAKGSGVITISRANVSNSPVVQVNFRVNLGVGKTIRLPIRYLADTLVTGSPIKLKVDIHLDQDTNTLNDSAVTGVLSS